MHQHTPRQSQNTIQLDPNTPRPIQYTLQPLSTLTPLSLLTDPRPLWPPLCMSLGAPPTFCPLSPSPPPAPRRCWPPSWRTRGSPPWWRPWLQQTSHRSVIEFIRTKARFNNRRLLTPLRQPPSLPRPTPLSPRLTTQPWRPSWRTPWLWALRS